MSLTAVRHYLAYVVFRTLFCALAALHIDTCYSMAKVLALLASDVVRLRRRVIDDNLRHAFPELSAKQRRQMARRMWEHLLLFIAESVQVPRKIHETNWRDHITLENPELLTQALFDPRPIALISAHFGSFELAGYFLGVLGYSSHAIARTLDNPYLNRYVIQSRQKTRQHIIPKKGGFDQIVSVLEAGGTVSFLADQYAGTKGCWVKFFGRDASAHKAVALLSLAHNCWVGVGSAKRIKPLHYRVGLRSLVDPHAPGSRLTGVRELTQWYTNELEDLIREAPDQYWWLHKRWKDHRPPKVQRRAAA